ncbi:zeta-sarcoglycan-like isoform X2 [Embiotoca jacksoni]|uniref:zeta-sarcoglycan-like isoform X2 n=1 Tax=Embiotoca jacksoni TaxID=100190 RepID=UPI003704B1D7
MEQSATLDVETLKITQEQFIPASRSLHLRRPGCDAAYPAGLYGWRKRCLYFFLLLLLVTMIVNLALTVWIIKVMNFSTDGMGNLRLNRDGIRLEGISEFLLPLYVDEIQSRRFAGLAVGKERNTERPKRPRSAHRPAHRGTGGRGGPVSEAGSAKSGRRQTPVHRRRRGSLHDHGEVHSHRLESPTRTLTMEAPRGVEVSAAKGPLKVSGRKDLHLESTEGEILLDANSVQLGRLPLAVFAPSPGHASPEQAAYELCVCPSGKIYRSPAESSSTCQAMSNICLWS